MHAQVQIERPIRIPGCLTGDFAGTICDTSDFVKSCHPGPCYVDLFATNFVV